MPDRSPALPLALIFGLTLWGWGCGSNEAAPADSPGDAGRPDGLQSHGDLGTQGLQDLAPGESDALPPEVPDRDGSRPGDIGPTIPDIEPGGDVCEDAVAPRDVGNGAADLIDEGTPGGRGPPYPILLQHGWTGFESIGPLEYFFQVKKHLEEHGFEVYVSEVAPYNDSEVRGLRMAENLESILSSSGAARVNVIAHSQGGIDTRYIISTLGYGDRIASLTTISTPHHGTRLGDAYLGMIPGWTDGMSNGLAWLLGVAISEMGDDPDLRASMWQISETTMQAFNDENPDDPRVAYFSWAGRSFLNLGRGICDEAEVENPPRVDICTVWLQATGRFVGESLLHPKPNDGLVAVESARWGRFQGCIPADHIDEVGHIAQVVPDPLSGFNHRRFYLGIASFLRGEGF